MADLAALLAEQQRRAGGLLYRYFRDDGPCARANYRKHLAFFAAGRTHRERAFLAANRVGKTDMGIFETVLHLTGRYDEYAPWWTGRRFEEPVQAWVAGDTAKTSRNILQHKLLGPRGQYGTGLLPAQVIDETTPKAGVPDAVEHIWVRHVSGGRSVVEIKSYDQRRESFQGTGQHLILLDEEPPEDIYTECVLRTAQTTTFPGGIILLTFTPLLGLTPLVLSFLPGGQWPPVPQPGASGKWAIMADWDDVPHLSGAEKAQLIASIPPHQRDARTKGIPMLGAGAIYPVPESDIMVDDFPIPPHYPRGYGMDVGWNATAAVWGALDRESHTLYLYACHRRGEAEPVVQAEAIKGRGVWIPGRIDPAARGRSQVDGRALLTLYLGLGLQLDVAPNAVEAGIYEVWTRLSSGRLKVFRSCGAWWEEFRLYRRDAKGRVVKEHDHLMDGTRYLVAAGTDWLRTAPVTRPAREVRVVDEAAAGLGWMA